MSFGDGDLHERVVELERAVAERDEWLGEIWKYVAGGSGYCSACMFGRTCDLEIYADDCWMRGVFAQRLREFGIEV